MKNTKWRKHSLTPYFYTKAHHKIFHEIGAIPIPGRGKYSLHQKLRDDAEMDKYEQIYYSNPHITLVSPMYFPVTVLQFMDP